MEIILLSVLDINNRIIIQYGTFIPLTTNENKTVTIKYPISFSNNNYSLCCTRVSTRYVASYDCENLPISTSTTGFSTINKAYLSLVKSCWVVIGF